MTFLEALNSGKIVAADGSKGAVLGRYGFQPTDMLVLSENDIATLENKHHGISAKIKAEELLAKEGPAHIYDLHEQYADLIQQVDGYLQTNTFTHPLNYKKLFPDLSDAELKTLVEMVNVSALRLAQTAAHNKAAVVVSVGPPDELRVQGLKHSKSGKEMKYDHPLDEVARWTGIQVAATLSLQQSPDAINIETVQRISVLEAMVKGAKQAIEKSGQNVPIIATMAPDATNYPETTPEKLMDLAKEYGLVAIGINCLNYLDAAGVMKQFKNSPVPLIAKFNLGQNAEEAAAATPETLKHYVGSLAALKNEGVPIAVIGGCCRMAPEHLAHVVDAIAALS